MIMANEKIITLNLLETFKNKQDKLIADSDALASLLSAQRQLIY